MLKCRGMAKLILKEDTDKLILKIPSSLLQLPYGFKPSQRIFKQFFNFYSE